MLTTLGPYPIVITMRRIRRIIITKWITLNPRWLLPSALDTATHLPEADITPIKQHHYTPPTWTAMALCQQLSTKESDVMFFGIEGRKAPAQLIAAANAARQICAQCPVAVICLTEALTNDERYGVWGGTSGRQREKLQTRLAAGATIPELVNECLPQPQLTT